jgi:hypothetical protein
VAGVRASRGVSALALAALALVSGCQDQKPSLGPNEPATSGDDVTVLFSLQDQRINESSGLAASRKHPGVYYTHNDRGHAPRVYAVSGETGATQAVLEIDTTPEDWEDIEVTESGVWVGDIGGGADLTRSKVSVLHFPEPDELSDDSPAVTEYELVYEDGPHNAEALMVDPQSDQVYVVTKDSRGGAIYAAPSELSAAGGSLVRVAKAPPNITAASWSPDGPGFALRNYPRAFVYSGLGVGSPKSVELPRSPQGESLVLLDDGDLLVGSEGVGSQVLRIAVAASS